jgi:hypothetical protein
MTQQASQRREATLADKQSTSATNQSERFKQAVRERGCHDIRSGSRRRLVRWRAPSRAHQIRSYSPNCGTGFDRSRGNLCCYRAWVGSECARPPVSRSPNLAKRPRFRHCARARLSSGEHILRAAGDRGRFPEHGRRRSRNIRGNSRDLQHSILVGDRLCIYVRK